VQCNAPPAGSEERGFPPAIPIRISCRHDDADPTWFVISHVDKTGRRWCHADAILSMQGLVRGWVIRQKRKRAQLREERNKKSKHAVQIQRWWRRYLFRKFVAQLRRERIAQAYIDILRFIKLCHAAPPPSADDMFSAHVSHAWLCEAQQHCIAHLSRILHYIAGIMVHWAHLPPVLTDEIN
jgi:hypothetical protein